MRIKEHIENWKSCPNQNHWTDSIIWGGCKTCGRGWTKKEIDETEEHRILQEKEADKSINEVNAELSDIKFDAEGNPTTLDDEMGKDEQEGNVKEGEI